MIFGFMKNRVTVVPGGSSSDSLLGCVVLVGFKWLVLSKGCEPVKQLENKLLPVNTEYLLNWKMLFGYQFVNGR